MIDQPLLPISCPQCGQSIIAHGIAIGRPESATSYDSCLRRCEPCGIGFSNARTSDVQKLTRIYKNPLDNIPAEVRVGALETLANAVNIQNRKSKLKKFAFSTSEDAITWTVFRTLQLTGQLRDTFSGAGVLAAQRAKAEPSLLLWGAPVPASDANGGMIAGRLADIAKQVEDDPQSRSEPDVVLDFGDAGCVIIEVKHRSANEIKPAGYAGWSDYVNNTNAFDDSSVIAESGFYELARNWRIGWDLSGKRGFYLVNLGPASLFSADAPPLERFVAALPERHRDQFLKLRWGDMIRSIPSVPIWLSAFLDVRGIPSGLLSK